MINKDEWLNSLKVGDAVAFDTGKYGSKKYIVDTIMKKTPTGRFKTSQGYEFDKSGVNRTDKWFPYWLEPLTDDIINQNKRAELLRKLQSVDFKEFKMEKLQRIYDVIFE